SEAGSAAVGVGASMAGMRPFVDLGTGSFTYLAWSQITNEAAVAHYMSNGRLTVPVTFHMLHGVRGGGAPQHSQSPHAMLWNAPGLEIAAPSTAADVYGLIRTALASPNPSVVVSHAKLLGIETPVPEQKSPIPFGRADIKRHGRDVTVVATSLMVHYCLAAAETLAKEGVDVEIVDPRTLVPLDEETILDSVSRTGRLVVVDECPLRGGIASEIAATVAERGFRYLKAPIVRVTRPDTPVPYSLPLENFIMPDPEKIAAGVRRVLAAA
ncbi:MAG: alpha-ketoacid dehydrogenase subunit beta, partial [Betaproteobacteria bacterium]|nr:alpha-ketoacid dehydrogenase subunit beta [Betaproteobacteria bacterium]